MDDAWSRALHGRTQGLGKVFISSPHTPRICGGLRCVMGLPDAMASYAGLKQQNHAEAWLHKPALPERQLTCMLALVRLWTRLCNAPSVPGWFSRASNFEKHICPDVDSNFTQVVSC
jgi:hypothetical protein